MVETIPRKDYTVTKNSRVCGRHFRTEDIEWEKSAFDEKAGRIITAPLKNPRLKASVTPQIFPKCPEYLSKDTTLRESLAKKKLRLESEHVSKSVEIEPDVANHTQYKMGFSKKLLLVDRVLPSKFQCKSRLRTDGLNVGTSGSAFVKNGKTDLADVCKSGDDSGEKTTEMEPRGTSCKTMGNNRHTSRKPLKKRAEKNGLGVKKKCLVDERESITNTESEKVHHKDMQHTWKENNSLHDEVIVPSDLLQIKSEPCEIESDETLFYNAIFGSDLPHLKQEQCDVENNDSLFAESILGSDFSNPKLEQSEIYLNFGQSHSSLKRSPTKTLKRRLTKTENLSTAANKLMRCTNSKNEKGTPQHPVDTFLASIAPTLKSFSSYHLHLAKTEIFNTVQKYKLETIRGDQHSA